MAVKHLVPDGLALSAMRERRGLSQADLERSSRVSAVTISRIETGRTNSVYPRTLRKLAKALGAQTEELILGHDDDDVNLGRGDRRMFVAINGRYVLARRKSLLITQTELAEMIKRSRATLHKIEHSVPELPCMVQPATLRALAKALKVPADTLVDTENQTDYMQEYYSAE